MMTNAPVDAPLETYEFAILLGRTVRKPRGVPETIAGEDILRKYMESLLSP